MAWAALKRNASRFVQAFNTETRIACRSWTIHWLGWCWPLLLFGVISGVYQAGTLLDMPLAVVDKDHSQLSRKLIRDLDATSHAQVITVPAGVQEGLDAIRRADAYALLYIPPDFEADVLGGRAPKAELYYNALLYSAGYAATQPKDSSARAQNLETAIQHLRKALDGGLRDWGALHDSPDLRVLDDSPAYHELLREAARKD